jgi:hypothetical protein
MSKTMCRDRKWDITGQYILEHKCLTTVTRSLCKCSKLLFGSRERPQFELAGKLRAEKAKSPRVIRELFLVYAQCGSDGSDGSCSLTWTKLVLIFLPSHIAQQYFLMQVPLPIRTGLPGTKPSQPSLGRTPPSLS